MAIVLFGDSFTFPEGNAATNHVYTYAKGFAENGINVHVICFKNEYLDEWEGITENVKFYHPFKQNRRSSFFIMRRWHTLAKYVRAFKLIRKINKNDKIVVINLWSYMFSTQFFAFVLSRYCRAKLILERSEHPLQYYKKGHTVQQFYGSLRLRLEIKLYDGIFCISNYLVDFYKSRGYDYQRLFLVPSTVDTGRFNHNFSPRLPFKYILYCGALTIQKDGVDILIKSFYRVSGKFPDINLVLIGKGETFNNDEIGIRELVGSLNMEKRIIFLGQVSRLDVPSYLSTAEVLALARPRSIVADAGFPSKLTEYLATGKPIVVTKVGEIPLYLKDNENAFLSEPDSVDAFANKLDYVLSNYQLAVHVSQRGKDLTKTVFNYNYQAGRMLDFIHSLWHA